MAKIAAEERSGVGWLDSGLVQRLYINPTIAGNPDENWLAYVKRRHLPKPVSRGLTLGCGNGGLERHGASLHLCEHHDAIDMSPGAIEIAKAAAVECGLTNVTYDVQDLDECVLARERYDVVFSSMAIHHVENLERLFGQVRASLRPGGLFVFNEYVGPDRFQWTRRQLIVVNVVLRLLPQRLRRSLRDGQIKTIVLRPTREAMRQLDPSEAIRSSAILRLVASYFQIVERVDYGGAILHMALQDIVGNFRAESRRDVRILRLLCGLERSLLRLRVLRSDFAVVVARRG